MKWDKIALAISVVMFVSVFPGAIVVVHESGDGRIEISPATYIPDEIIVDNVVRIEQPGESFEVSVLNGGSPETVTKIIFGPSA